MSKKQIINPYIRFGPRSQGPYAQRLNGSTYGRAMARGLDCFFITSSEIGNNSSDADIVTTCYNEDYNTLDCRGAVFTYKLNGTPYITQTYLGGPNSQCQWVQVLNGSENSGTGPQDSVTLDYTPGTCRKDGTSGDECALKAFTDKPVENSVWGPGIPRIGDISDDLLIIPFPTDPAVIGTSWRVDVNALNRTITNSVIVANQIRLTLSTPVSDTDVVTLSHVNSNDAQAVDGRRCWRFYDMPVTNVVGVSFWNTHTDEAWLIDPKTGRWRLE